MDAVLADIRAIHLLNKNNEVAILVDRINEFH